MSPHKATVIWKNKPDDDATALTSFVHQWVFDGGVAIDASPSPFVMPQRATEQAIDPEEAFIAAIASCHLMTFLTVAEKQRFVVESYHDEATGTLGTNENGKTAVTEVVLKPKIAFRGNQPTRELVAKMHKLAHKHCFIANSVTTDIRIEQD